MGFSTSVFLIEFEAYNSDTSSVEVERFATADYITKKSETPSLAKYPGRIQDAGNLEIFLFGNARTTGNFSFGVGRVRLLNGDRALDYLSERGLDGRPITIREKTGASYPDDFPVRFKGVITYSLVSTVDVVLDVKSLTSNLSALPFQTVKYAGTNNGSTIFLEGTEDDTLGQNKPKMTGGVIQNVRLPLVDRANEIYQVSSDPVHDMPAVYVGRSVIPRGTTHTTLANFVTAATTGAVTGGTYDVYFGDWDKTIGDNERGCFIAFGTTPTKVVTADVTVGWHNLCTYSTLFSNAAWTKTNTTVTSGVTDPAGGTSAFSLLETSATGVHEIEHSTMTITANRTVVGSVFIKPNGRTSVRLTLGDSAYTNSFYSEFTLTGAGAVATSAATGASSHTESRIELLDSGFYRVVIVGKVNGSVSSVKMKLALKNTTLSYAGDTTKGTHIWEAQVEQGDGYATPPSTASATAVFKDSCAQIVYRVLKEKGYETEVVSAYLLDAASDYSVQDAQAGGEASTASVVAPLLRSVHAYLVGNTSGTFSMGKFSLPTEPEIEYVLDERVLLGSPKVKVLDNNDTGQGVPVYRTNVNYAENYTVMSESDIFGVAELTDIPFISRQFRTEFDEDTAVQTKHLTSTEMDIDTKLVNQADAAAFAAEELALYGSARTIIQFRVPIEFGATLDNGDVVKWENKIYRIIGKTLRFPVSRNSEVTTRAITFQAWGGVAV